MDLSVIVRTIGREERLADALDSLASQTFRRFEAVVVDMGPRPIQHVLEASRDRIPALRHLRIGRRLDRPIALNYGIERAGGEAIAVLDDDNRYEPSHLGTLEEGLTSTGADLVYAGVRRETRTPAGDLAHVDVFHQTRFDYARLLAENFIYTSSMAFRKTIWQRVGGYDGRFPVYEDWDFLIRVGRIGRIQAVGGYTAVSRSFTGQPGLPEHHREKDCQRCWVGLMWRHRRLRRRLLRDRGELLEAEGRHLPRYGVRRKDLRLLIDWWWSCRQAGVSQDVSWPK